MFEAIYRTAIIYSNLLEDHNGTIARSDAYKGLDPSEKGAISYFLGLSLTKAFAANYLHVPWLMHLDVYRSRYSVNLAKGERPDLFGIDNSGRWIVVESKGRTNAHDTNALIKAKRQASMLRSVGGVVPSLSLGAVASFEKDRLTLCVDDPPVDDESKHDVEVASGEFSRTYYRPIEQLIDAFDSNSFEFGNSSITAVRIEAADIEIGLVDNAVEFTRRRADLSSRDPLVVEPTSGSTYLGPDGVFVKLGSSWENAQMRLEPQARTPTSDQD